MEMGKIKGTGMGAGDESLCRRRAPLSFCSHFRFTFRLLRVGRKRGRGVPMSAVKAKEGGEDEVNC